RIFRHARSRLHGSKSVVVNHPESASRSARANGDELTTSLRLLLIEDCDDDATLVIRELSRAGYLVTSERVDTADALIAALTGTQWDLAIADFTMPRFTGTAALKIVRQFDQEIPFIFVSGTIGEDAAVAAMQSGAQDYIMKGPLGRL